MAKIKKPEKLGLCSTRLAKINGWMQGYVDAGKLPCAMTLVARHGEIAYLDHCGLADVAMGRPLEADTIFRIYSMTKPITALAVMMLYEDALFQLDDPLEAYLPEFADMRVYHSGHGSLIRTVPANEPITIRHLLTHTAGMTYGFLDPSPIGELYRTHDINFNPGKKTLAETVEDLADLPLVHQPGAQWNYGVSFDVLGRFVEVVSGEPLDRFFDERILKPLGMTDTSFSIADDKVSRFAALYHTDEDGGIKMIEGAKESSYERPMLASGGGGLVSTMADFFRFTELMRRKGELDGVRLVGRKSVEYMTANHLGGDMAAMGQPTFGESRFDGVGFGFGVSVMLDPALANIMGTPGEFAWGGAASTAFWIDPVEDMTVIFLTQLMPSSAYPIRRQLRILTYQALVD